MFARARQEVLDRRPVLDLLKGVILVVIGRCTDCPIGQLACSRGRPIGQRWSPYTGFTGGKGSRPAVGQGLPSSPWLLLLVPVIVTVVLVTRYVSLASIVTVTLASIVSVIAAATGHLPWSWALAIVDVGDHRATPPRQHRRLRAGTENKFGSRVAST